MSSRQRLYLNLKQSILELFRTPAHWIKEFTGKWSIFDKPYLSEDYRGMHLDWPGPDWPADPEAPPGFFPKEPPPKLWTFLWDMGECWNGIINADCGEEFSFHVSVRLIPLYSLGTGINFWVTSSEPDKVVITSIGDSDSNIVFGEASQFSAQVKGYLVDNWTGIASICVRATLGGGRLLTGFQVVSPYGEGPGVLTVEQGLLLPKLWQREISTFEWDCGCIELEVACCNTSTPIAWDDLSDDTITRPNGGGEYADIAITGSGTPFTWSVSGTGFELLYAQTNGTSNVLIADASACGSASITVTDCDGNIATGDVRCATGTWSQSSLCDESGSCSAWECWVSNLIIGQYRYNIIGPCAGNANDCIPYTQNCNVCPGSALLVSNCTGCDYVCSCGGSVQCFSYYQKVETWGCA